MALAVIVPVHGGQHLTDAVLGDLAAERALVEVYVVDNLGDYEASGTERRVLTPPENLGWLRGSNAGMRAAMADGGFDGYVLLNNDVRLSPGFVAALVQAAARPGVGIVGPTYDDRWRFQKTTYRGPAGDYPPGRRVRRVPFVDGTCLAVTARCVEAIGLLDEEAFAPTGWGADIDYGMRARRAGFDVVVTEGAFLNHFPASTAHALASVDEYWQRGNADMLRGLEQKWGPDWRRATGLEAWTLRERLARRLRPPATRPRPG